jgi:hypothetical protein
MCVVKGKGEQLWDRPPQDLQLYHFTQVVWRLRGLI